MTTYHQLTEAEERARRKLAQNVGLLRAAVIDLLQYVRASDDPWPASTGIPLPEPERLRREANRVELRDATIHRIRKLIDDSKHFAELAGNVNLGDDPLNVAPGKDSVRDD